MSSNATFTVGGPAHRRFPWMPALAAACAIGAAGCEATFTPVEPVVTVWGTGTVAPVTAVPTDIWGYPRVYYGGTYTYLVNGLWYQPTPRGWVVFRREPIELGRERTRIYAAPRRVVPRTPAYAYPRSAPTPPVEYGRERTPGPR